MRFFHEYDAKTLNIITTILYDIFSVKNEKCLCAILSMTKELTKKFKESCSRHLQNFEVTQKKNERPKRKKTESTLNWGNLKSLGIYESRK